MSSKQKTTAKAPPTRGYKQLNFLHTPHGPDTFPCKNNPTCLITLMTQLSGCSKPWQVKEMLTMATKVPAVVVMDMDNAAKEEGGVEVMTVNKAVVKTVASHLTNLV